MATANLPGPAARWSATGDSVDVRPPVGGGTWATFVRWAGVAAVASPFVHQLLVTAAAPLVQPGYSPVSQAASDLGVGPAGGWIRPILVVLGLVMVALAAAFFLALRPVAGRARRWTCAVLTAVPGIGAVVAAVFTEAPATVLIHWLVGAVLGGAFPVVTFLVVGLALRRAAGWRGFAAFSIPYALFYLAVIAFMQQALTPGSALAAWHVGGLAERAALVARDAWYAVIGWRLFRWPDLEVEA